MSHRPNGVNGETTTDGNGINGQPADQRRPRDNGVNGRSPRRPDASGFESGKGAGVDQTRGLIDSRPFPRLVVGHLRVGV